MKLLTRRFDLTKLTNLHLYLSLAMIIKWYLLCLPLGKNVTIKLNSNWMAGMFLFVEAVRISDGHHPFLWDIFRFLRSQRKYFSVSSYLSSQVWRLWATYDFEWGFICCNKLWCSINSTFFFAWFDFYRTCFCFKQWNSIGWSWNAKTRTWNGEPESGFRFKSYRFFSSLQP